MAILGLRSGAWGTPELGISEKVGDLLGKGRNSQGGSNLFGGSSAPAYTGQVLGTQTANPGVNQYNSPISASKLSPVNVNKGANSFGDMLGKNSNGLNDPTSNIISPSTPFAGGPSQVGSIDQEFESYNSLLGQQEQMANRNYNDTLGMYATQKSNQEQQLATDKANQTDQIKKTEALNLSKVRQLLADLNQSNAARTAITGGGSASDVISERFGRTAQAQLGNVMDQTTQSLQRVNDFYNNAISSLNDNYQTQLMNAKQALDENILNINSARQQSASAKQANTVQAWRDYYDKINTAKTEAANFKQQYDMWKQQQDNAYGAQLSSFQTDNANQYNAGIQPSFNKNLATGAPTQQTFNSINPMFRTGYKQEDPNDPNNPKKQNFSFINPAFRTK